MSENQSAADDVTLLFYRRISVLRSDQHGTLKIGQPPSYDFTATTNSVPLAGVEFGEAVKEYPIVFARDELGTVSAAAVLGLENGENLFLGKQGNWDSHYLPAFVRRYPFILGSNPENPTQPWVCVDEACPWLGQDSGEALFTGTQPSAFMGQVMAFLVDYNGQLERTAAFGRKLADWGLLMESQAQASTADGAVHTLTGIWTVDEAELAKLEGDKLQELFKTGELAWIFFHLNSLSNFRLLADRKTARRAA
jgi:hypothetical protein